MSGVGKGKLKCNRDKCKATNFSLNNAQIPKFANSSSVAKRGIAVDNKVNSSLKKETATMQG